MTFGIPSSTWICDAIRVTWGAHARTHTHTEACAATPLPTVYHQPLKGRRPSPAVCQTRLAPAASDSSPTTVICRISGRAHQPQAA